MLWQLVPRKLWTYKQHVSTVLISYNVSLIHSFILFGTPLYIVQEERIQDCIQGDAVHPECNYYVKMYFNFMVASKCACAVTV